MKKYCLRARDEWERLVAEAGLSFPYVDGELYWDETSCYSLTQQQTKQIFETTQELHRMCMAAVAHVIRNNRFAELQIPKEAIPIIKLSWERGDPWLLGRFDLSYDGNNPPKMLECNADTPGLLVECGLPQRNWQKDVFPVSSQFNSIDRLLADRLNAIASKIDNETLYFCCHSFFDDEVALIRYLMKAAQECGMRTKLLLINDIGWDGHSFVDLENNPLKNVYMYQPWEWMLESSFGKHISETYSQMLWIEPAWKMILSSKAILSVLWELFPEHPNLLEARPDNPGNMATYARKPFFSREGDNILLVDKGEHYETDGPEENGRFVYQELALLPRFGNSYTLLGSWIIGNEPAGIGFRESKTPITDYCCFVPHIVETGAES